MKCLIESKSKKKESFKAAKLMENKRWRVKSCLYADSMLYNLGGFVT